VNRQLQQPTIRNLWAYLLSCEDSENRSKFECEEEFRDKLWEAAEWPPDVFCLVAAVLRLSGAYTWLPLDKLSQLHNETQEASLAWRREIGSAGGKLEKPQCLEICDRYLIKLAPVDLGDVCGAEPKHVLVRDCCSRPDLQECLGRLLMMADDASSGLGLPSISSDYSQRYGLPLRYLADFRLNPGEFGSTLCRAIHPSKARVLPKTHTPPSGRTLRSLSHHLCYVESDEGRPLWLTVPSTCNSTKQLNVLVIPHPPEIDRDCFKLHPDGKGYSIFSFTPRDSCGLIVKEICNIVERASKDGSAIDVVVLPELSLCAADYRLLRGYLLAQKITLIAGLGGTNQEGDDENRLALDVPLSSSHAVHFRQRKHHPWRMDAKQVQQYGLSEQFKSGMDTSRSFWERLRVGDRNTCFVALHPRILASVLICEDLAQYEPVGRLIRAVGPNLVLALLLDGPQISGRWPERYATVLSDDPGSSVLTLTGLGMSRLSRRVEKDGRDLNDRTGVIALWKGPDGKKEIALDREASAVILEIDIGEQLEWTADLRSRNAVALRLSNCIQVPRAGGDEEKRPEFDDRQPPLEIKFIAPVEASALARLARLQAESPMEEWARHYITEIAPSLDIEGRKIAMQMLARKLKDEFVLRQNSNLEPLGPEEKRQMEILRIGVGDPVLGQCGVEWKELPKGYENECSTADEITRWAEDLNLMGKYSDPSLTGS
jgi:hypothetical protein